MNPIGAIPDAVSNKFRNMSAVCALLVVIIHCHPEAGHGGAVWWMKQMLECGVCELAVPFFFFASGFFIATKLDGGYRFEIVKRLRTLMIPYLIWICLFMIMEIMRMVLLREFSVPTLDMIGLNPGCMPVLSPLWYIRALFCLVLISPLILRMLRKWPLCVLVALGCLYGIACPYAPLPEWDQFRETARIGPMPVLGLFYYSAGIAIRIGLVKSDRIEKIPPSMVFGIGLALSFSRAVAISHGQGWVAAYCGFASLPFLIYGLWKLMPEKLWPQSVVAASFPIYLIHKFPIPLVHRLIDKNTPLGYVLYVSCLYLVSWLTAIAIRRFLPRAAAVMFGGR